MKSKKTDSPAQAYFTAPFCCTNISQFKKYDTPPQGRPERKYSFIKKGDSGYQVHVPGDFVFFTSG